MLIHTIIFNYLYRIKKSVFRHYAINVSQPSLGGIFCAPRFDTPREELYKAREKRERSWQKRKRGLMEQEEEIASALCRPRERVTHPDHGGRYDPIRSPSLCRAPALAELKRFSYRSGHEMVATSNLGTYDETASVDFRAVGSFEETI